MGANQFFVYIQGRTPQEAFNKARTEARYSHGHRGYTGSIAEKQNVAHINRTPRKTALLTAYQAMDQNIHNTDDKWGPAGCIPASAKEVRAHKERHQWERGQQLYLLFGWASC